MIPKPVYMPLKPPKLVVNHFQQNGWDIIFLPKQGSLLSVRCLLKGGALSELEGLANLRDRNILQLMELSTSLPVLSGEIDLTTSSQYSHISYDGLCEELDDVISIINTLCTTSPQVDLVFEDCLQQMSSELRSANDWPQNVLYAVFRHRCSKLKWGTQGHYSTLYKYNSIDLIQSWESYFFKPSGTLIVVGDIDGSRLKTSLSSLPNSYSRHLESQKYTIHEEHYYVNMDLEQTHFIMITPIIGAADPDFEAWRTAVQILSGDIDGRIPKALRIEAGLTYDLSAFILEDNQESLLILSSSVSDFEESLNLINTELKQAHRDLSKQEIKKALLQLNIEKLETLGSCGDLADRIEQQWQLNHSVPPELIENVIPPNQTSIQNALECISKAKWLCIAVGPKNPLPDLFKTIDKPSSID